jgi:effector-binding domain-containing protein
MKVLKTIGIILLLFAAGYTLLCFVGPKRPDVKKSIVIEASPEAVFNYVNDLNTWPQWASWFKSDSTMKVSFAGLSIGKGASYSWTSKKSGDGTMTIVTSDAAKLIQTEIVFSDFNGKSLSDFIFESIEGGKTMLTWTMGADTDFPFFGRGFLWLMNFNKAIGKDYEKGLANLKKLIESNPQGTAVGAYTVQRIDYPAKTFIAQREKISFDKMTNFYATNFGSIMGEMMPQGAEMDGGPSGLFYVWDMENKQADMAAAIPFKEPINYKGKHSLLKLPARKALQIDYYGPYEGTGAAHDALDKYMAEQKMKSVYPVIEEYITDPVAEPDTSKWLTRVIYFYE